MHIAGRTPRDKQYPKGVETFVGAYTPQNTTAAISRSKDIGTTFVLKDEGDYLMDPDHFSAKRSSPSMDVYRLRLKIRPFLRMLFCNPSLASMNASMDDYGLLIDSQ